MALRYLARRVRIPDFQRARGRRMSPPPGSRPFTSRSSQGGQGPEVDVVELIRKDPKTATKVLQEEEIARLRAKLRAGREAMEELKRRDKYRKLWLGTCGATGIALGMLAAAADIRRQRENFIRSF